MVGTRGRAHPISLMFGVVLLGVALTLLREPSGRVAGPAAPCDPLVDPLCEDATTRTGPGAGAAGPPSGPVVDAAEACRGSGYLCVDLERTGRMRIQRWRGFEGTLVVHVPLPDHEDPGLARQLQSAAAAGLRAWNGQPFAILVDERGDRSPHFSVRWRSVMNGSQIGLTRTQWSSARGLEVLAIELATRLPYDASRTIEARQVRLTAAHEMGHALGLPHSDSRRDVMYPTNTATSLSAQDYVTMEALYRLEDGTEIIQ